MKFIVTGRLNGRVVFLNNCDGFSATRQAAKKFSRPDAQAAVVAVGADRRWSKLVARGYTTAKA